MSTNAVSLGVSSRLSTHINTNVVSLVMSPCTCMSTQAVSSAVSPSTSYFMSMSLKFYTNAYHYCIKSKRKEDKHEDKPFLINKGKGKCVEA